MRSISDVMRAVPGASVASGEGHRDVIILRGQNSTADFFVDGIRDDVQYYRGLYNLDRVEVLKGPNAMIFGRGGGGGVVNRVTKKADGERAANGAFAVDSHGAWYRAIDLQAPLTTGVSGRVNAVYETFDSFRDHVDGRRIGVNPTLGWQPGDETRVDLAYEYSTTTASSTAAIPSREGPSAEGRAGPVLRRSRRQPRCASTPMSATSRSSIASATRCAGPARRASATMTNSTAIRFAAGPATAAGTVAVEAYQARTERDALFVQNDFVASLATGPVAHTLLFGVDYGDQEACNQRQQGFFNAAARSMRISVPLASSDDLPPIFFRDSPVRRATRGRQRCACHRRLCPGPGADRRPCRDHRRPAPRLVPARDARPHLGRRCRPQGPKWSPRLGLVVKPMPSLSLYASWSKSFLPQSGDQFGLTPTLAALAPEKFGNREIGLKWAATPAIDVTLAGYILERSNTRATDPVDAARPC